MSCWSLYKSRTVLLEKSQTAERLTRTATTLEQKAAKATARPTVANGADRGDEDAAESGPPPRPWLHRKRCRRLSASAAGDAFHSESLPESWHGLATLRWR
jgi:hypothetical protein